MTPDPDDELAAAVDDAMADALADLAPLPACHHRHLPLLEHAPDPDDVIRRMRENGLPDPHHDDWGGLRTIADGDPGH